MHRTDIIPRTKPMTNNDVLRQIRYTFDFNDDKMMEIFNHVGFDAPRTLVSDWLKKEDHADFIVMKDKEMLHFLNGFIIEKRGKKEGVAPPPDRYLDNNIILKKIKIALALRNEDILDIFALVEKPISPHELSSFFRRPTQSQYRDCQDQYLRNFLYGLKKKYRPE